MTPKADRTGRAKRSSPVIPRTAGSRMSAPGIARRQLLLKTARKMLHTTGLGQISLAEIAKRAKVPKGSAYFFYEDVHALYASLKSLVDGEMLDILSEPITGCPHGWQDIVRLVYERGVSFLESDPAACQLAIGTRTTPALKLMDRANDIVVGRLLDEQISTRFELPPMLDRPKLFFRALVLADVMLSLSMFERGTITREYIDEGYRSAIVYLQMYIPQICPTVTPDQPSADPV